MNFGYHTLFIFLFVELLFSFTADASSIKFGFGNSFVSFTKVSGDGPVSGTVPIGFSAWGGYFLTDKISTDGSFEISLAEDKIRSQLSSVFMGGAGYISYYLTGGALKEISLKTLNVRSVPRFNTVLLVGAGGSAYNFNAFDSSTGKVVKRAPNNTLRGSTLGIVFGSGVSIAIKNNIFLSAQGKMFNGISDEITPEITNLVVGGGIEVML